MLAAIFVTWDFFFFFPIFTNWLYCIDLLERVEMKKNFDELDLRLCLVPRKFEGKKLERKSGRKEKAKENKNYIQNQRIIFICFFKFI